MLKIFLFAFILFLLAFFGMALGYIVKRKVFRAVVVV